MIKLSLVSILFLISVQISAQQSYDSISAGKSLFLIPVASYQQETSIAPGIAYAYYFKSDDISRISSISGSAVYTFRNQFTFNVTPKLFFENKKWYLYSNLNIRNYPDYFYGIGNKATTLKLTYTTQRFACLLQPQYSISKHALIGAVLSTHIERIKTNSVFELNKEAVFQQFGRDGWYPFSQLNIGLVAAFDNRDNQFYTEKGIFAKSYYTFSRVGWGSSYTLHEFSLDYRHYIPVFSTHVFAWQARFNTIFGTKGIPFNLLPTVGGRDNLRGFRQGMYRDNSMIVAQTEYRLPVYKRLKAAFFCAVGDVMNSSDYKIDKIKVAYGAGLRYRLNDARVHLRLDIAKNNYGDKFQFYITANEAF